jgi:hypothetical protein
LIVVSSKEERKKKRAWKQFCEWLSESVARLPTAVSLLLLVALFMQISGLSLTLTWPRRLCLLRVLLGTTTTATSFSLSKHNGGGDTAPTFSGLRVYLQFMWELGLPPLLWSFPPTATFTRFPTPDCWACATAPAFSSQLVVRDFPDLPLWCSGCPALFVSCLFCCYCLLFSFSFFPGWGLICPGDYTDLAQGCLWEYCVPLSSPCGLRLPKPSGCWHLAVWERFWFLCLT